MAGACCNDTHCEDNSLKTEQPAHDHVYTVNDLVSGLTMAETLHTFMNRPPTTIYKANFVVTSTDPQLKLKLADHYYLHDENDEVEYEKLTLEQRRYARRVVNEEITVADGLSDVANEMAQELALGDKLEVIYQLKSVKQFIQKSLDETFYPSEINIVDMKIVDRYSTLSLAYHTVFDPLVYILIAIALIYFIVFSGYYHQGFVWKWGVGGALILMVLFYWLYCQIKEFSDSNKCLKRNVRVHGESLFFSDKKSH